MNFGEAHLVLECHTGSNEFVSTYWQSTTTASGFVKASLGILSTSAYVVAGHVDGGLQSLELYNLLNESKDNEELFDSLYYFLRVEETYRVLAWQPLPSLSSSNKTDRYVGYMASYFDSGYLQTLIGQTAIDSGAILQNLDTVTFFAQKYGKG
jgi:hypothetical protein